MMNVGIEGIVSVVSARRRHKSHCAEFVNG